MFWESIAIQCLINWIEPLSHVQAHDVHTHFSQFIIQWTCVYVLVMYIHIMPIVVSVHFSFNCEQTSRENSLHVEEREMRETKQEEETRRRRKSTEALLIPSHVISCMSTSYLIKCRNYQGMETYKCRPIIIVLLELCFLHTCSVMCVWMILHFIFHVLKLVYINTYLDPVFSFLLCCIAKINWSIIYQTYHYKIETGSLLWIYQMNCITVMTFFMSS